MTTVPRARAAIIAVATMALLAGGASSSLAATERDAAARAVPGRMITAPAPEAVATRLPVRVAVRVPPRTRRLHVRLGRRDVTARFRRGRRLLRVARLTRSDGLRYGDNRISVLVQRRNRLRPVVQARSFVLARHQANLVRMRVRPGAVTRLGIRVGEAPGGTRVGEAAGGTRVGEAPGGAPDECDNFGADRNRLSAMRRERTVRLVLNGRRVTRALDRSRPTRWAASLTATQGLRHGVNRLRVSVVEPRTGRYTVLRRRFVVRRSRHLAAAGWDVATEAGRRVRLDGRRSRTARGGRVRHRWRIVSKPRGSRTVLRRARSPRPHLIPDRPGRYTVRLTATRRGPRQAVRTGADKVTVISRPNSLLLPIKALTYRGSTSGIQLGDRFYANPAPGSVQWLTVDRNTLAPTGAGNSWIGRGEKGEHAPEALGPAVCKGGLDQLVILAFPLGGLIFSEEQAKDFNDGLGAMGVGPIDPKVLTVGSQQLAMIGVPYGGPGSGWYASKPDARDDLLSGWLMPDAKFAPQANSVRFRFQPERPTFDTAVSTSATTNTMAVRDQKLPATLPAGSSGGFQVTTIDPTSFEAVDTSRGHFAPARTQVFSTNSTGNRAQQEQAVSGRKEMADFLDEVRGDEFSHVAIQSIGHVEAPPSDPKDYEREAAGAWWDLGKVLSRFGANPHYFNTVDGSYAFLGGPRLEKGETADSSTTAAEAQANPERGQLSGRATLRSDGVFYPMLASSTREFESSLYDKVFTAPTPWPFTEAAGEPRYRRYADAMEEISRQLFKGNPNPPPDIRSEYVGNDLDWSDQKSDLAKAKYPGDERNCNEPAGSLRRVSPPSYTRGQFCELVDQLSTEFTYLDNLRTLFDSYETALSRSGTQGQADLQSIGDAVVKATEPPPDEEVLTEVGEYLAEIVEVGAEVFAPEEKAAEVFAKQLSGAVHALVASYDLQRALVSDLSQQPVGDQIKAKVSDLSTELGRRQVATSGSLDRIRDVLNSDWGRLQALGSVARTKGWTVDISSTTQGLTDAANAYFYREILPVSYGVHSLQDTPQNNADDPDTCHVLGYGRTFRFAPKTAKFVFRGNYFVGDREFSYNPSWFVLGRHRLSLLYYAYPPASITNAVFRPHNQAGYGVRLPEFVWEDYAAPAPPTDLAYCH